MDDLIYYFVDDNELLKLINSDVSYTLNDDSIMGSKKHSQNINTPSVEQREPWVLLEVHFIAD